MRFKQLRLGPKLHRSAQRPGFLDQTHVLFGGTGAVGGATALQLLSMLEEAMACVQDPPAEGPRLVITARGKGEIRQFTSLLHKLQQRDHGRAPERVEGIGYRTAGGVLVELHTFAVDPAIPELAGFSVHDEGARKEAAAQFLATGGLTVDSPPEERAALLERAIAERVGRPFSRFLADYLEGRGGSGRVQSVIVGIPMASVCTYKLNDLDAAGPWFGVDSNSERMEELKEAYLRAIVDDLAEVARERAREVLVAHTTAVGGMYDEEEEGHRTIRMGFAHSAKGDLLGRKQTFARKLTTLYSERSIKMLITAAAIGVDAILVREKIPVNGRIRQMVQKALADGHQVVRESDVNTVRVYPPIEVGLTGGSTAPITFERGTSLTPRYAIRSGENGFFSVSNADALYRVMRVTSSTELGMTMARVAAFGDDPDNPLFTDNVCYYTETDNSRQVFDLLSDPPMVRDQLSGLEPKSLQDLGSAKHQGELHTLGLLILLHRLRTLDLDAIPRHVRIEDFQPRAYFEAHSRALTLEHLMGREAEPLAVAMTTFVQAKRPSDLEELVYLYLSDPERERAAHGILDEVIRAIWSVPSLGTPILFERGGERRVLTGYFAAPVDQVLTHGDSLGRYFRDEFERLGGGDEAAFDRFVEFHVANFGFADLRPVAVLNTARSADEDLEGKVRVFRDEASFLAALDELEPYSYFTTSGLIALLVRLKGLGRLSEEFKLELGSANEFRVHLFHDETGRPVLVPGVVEAFRMVWEGLEKNTGVERIDGRWGYPRP